MSEKRGLAFPAKQNICESLVSKQTKKLCLERFADNLRKKQEFTAYA